MADDTFRIKVDQYKRLIEYPDGTFAERVVADPPAILQTGTTNPRIRVDVAETGFFENREFRISQEISVAVGETVTYKFSSPVNFILQRQTLAVDTGGIRFTAYRANQGTEAGTFEPVGMYRVNLMTDAPPYTRQATVSVGGTFTPSVGEEPVEVIRVLTSNATAQRSTVSGSVGDQRGLAPGDYYLLFSALGTGQGDGTFDLKWEERL